MQAKCLSSHSLGDGGFEAFAKEMGDDLVTRTCQFSEPREKNICK